jgi:hypothetical protein
MGKDDGLRGLRGVCSPWAARRPALTLRPPPSPPPSSHSDNSFSPIKRTWLLPDTMEYLVTVREASVVADPADPH